MRTLALTVLVIGCGAARQYRCTVDNSESGQQTVECKRGQFDYVTCTKLRREDGILFEHCSDSNGDVWECEYNQDDTRKVCYAK